MRLFALALVSSLAAVTLTAATSSAVAARPTTPTPPTIVGYSVQPGGTYIDPYTHLTYREYTFTIEFTHQRGLIGFQVNEYPAGSTQKIAWDNNVVSETSIGTDTLTVQLGSVVTQPVYFKLFLYKPGQDWGKPSQRAEVVYDSRTTGTFTG
jgi:hypothetical protein